MDPLVHDIGAVPQVFIDDTLIAAARGLQRRVHPLVKPSPDPVLQATEPWEGVWTAPCAVIFDDTTKLWKMWYESSHTRKTSLPGAGHETMHIAMSRDGLHWEKPPLGAYQLKGGGDTNLCVWDDGRPCPAGVVFDEPADPDPSRRYKLIWYGPNYYLAYSADGIRWRPAQANPVWPNGAGDGLEETSFFFRDPLSGKYRGYMRVWRRHQTIRKNGLGESDDLLTWTGPKICWEAFPAYGTGAQIYGMHVHVDAGLYWAFPWIFYSDEPLDETLRQTIRLKLGWSRDGVNWNALAPETDIVPPGARGQAFDWGMLISNCPAVLTAEQGRLYYTGCDSLHDGSDNFRAVGLAAWRRGGLVSLQAPDEGVLLTHRFLFRGEELRINAETAPGGAIRAELLDDGGAVIKLNSLAASDPVADDARDHKLTWRGDGNLGRLHGQYLMLRLKLERADVYAFRAAGRKEKFDIALGQPPVRAGRCPTPPVIDGRLNDECWCDFTHSGVAADFVRFDRIEPAAVRTRALFTYDDRCLYIAVECEEPLTAHLAGPAGPGSIAHGYNRAECVELRLSAPCHGRGLHVHQLMITAAGGSEHNYFSKEAGHTRADLRDPWEVKTGIVPGRWGAEIAVPFATLNAPVPVAGERWKLNLIRYRHAAGNDISCWVCMFGSVHRTDLAGEIVFG